jgi:hypothetical protein
MFPRSNFTGRNLPRSRGGGAAGDLRKQNFRRRIVLLIVLPTIVTAAALPPYFAVAIVALCLLAIAVSQTNTVGEPVARTGMSLAAWLVLMGALAVAGTLLAVGVLQKLNMVPGGVQMPPERIMNVNGSPLDPTRETTDQVIVEDLALQMLVAIRDQDDATLKSLGTDSEKAGWRDALPHLALEMRERFQQMTGKPFEMRVSESLVEGDRAVVKCDGPKELNGVYLALFFVKTDEGWRNWTLCNSPASKPLAQHLAHFKPGTIEQYLPQLTGALNARSVRPTR